MTVKVRHVFQPREEVDVSDSEAAVLEAQGLLWKGTDAELAALLAADPVGPLNPRPAPPAPPVAAAKTTTTVAPAPGAKES